MKKSIKTTITAAISGALALTVFTGCSGANTEFNATKEITVITREEGSGTRDAFVELTGVLVKGGDTKTDNTRADAVTLNGTEAVITNVKGNNAAIGYISLGSLNDTVKALKIEDVEPTAENVKSGAYKISRPFNIAYKGDISGLTKDFVDFILSSEGQSVVADEGYVTVSENTEYTSSKPQGKITIAGSSSVAPVMEKLIEAYKTVNTGADIELQTSDSSAGMQAVMSGTCDIGMASRDLKDTESELISLTIAKDGIAVIVNTGNTADSLTMEQVKTIYTGEATAWSDIIK